MGFIHANVPRTAHSEATHTLRKCSLNAHSLIIKKWPVRLMVSLSGSQQSLIMGISSKLNAPTFHTGTLMANWAGYAMLTGELDKHAGLAIFRRIEPGLRRMPLGTVGPPMRWPLYCSNLC